MPSASARGRMLSAGANPHMLHKERDSTIEVHRTIAYNPRRIISTEEFVHVRGGDRS
ncbi:hypothetical protein E4U34_001119 [Claviceps purpurea]|nr:hypothetical protein E4U34_001119 [Claviceps purpurea]